METFDSEDFGQKVGPILEIIILIYQWSNLNKFILLLLLYNRKDSIKKEFLIKYLFML